MGRGKIGSQSVLPYNFDTRPMNSSRFLTLLAIYEHKHNIQDNIEERCAARDHVRQTYDGATDEIRAGLEICAQHFNVASAEMRELVNSQFGI